MTVAAFTGHRPQKLGGYGFELNDRLVRLARKALADFTVRQGISGMALGWDMAAAQACIDLSVPFVAAIPFAGQESRWPKESQRRYETLLGRAERVEIVSPGGYSRDKMHVRDKWMVDRGQILIALHDGSPSGTGLTVDYARTRGVEVCNMWPFWAG